MGPRLAVRSRNGLQDQLSEITRNVMYQRRQWVHFWQELFGCFYEAWSELSWITDPDPDHPKGMHSKTKGKLIIIITVLTVVIIISIYWILLLAKEHPTLLVRVLFSPEKSLITHLSAPSYNPLYSSLKQTTTVYSLCQISRETVLVLFSRASWCFPRRSRWKHQDSREKKTNWFTQWPDIRCFVIFLDFQFNVLQQRQKNTF